MDPDLHIRRGCGRSDPRGRGGGGGGRGVRFQKLSVWSKNKVWWVGGVAGPFFRTNEIQCRDDVMDTVKQC